MAFATTTDVETRLGRGLTSAESALAAAVITSVEGLIAEALGKDQDWIDALDPVPTTLSQLCIEKAVALITNPEGAASVSETLGAYSNSTTFPRAADIGIFLSRDEVARVRQAVSGLSRGTARQASVVDDVIEIRYSDSWPTS